MENNQEQQSSEVEVIISPQLEKVVSENSLMEKPKAMSHALAFAPKMNKVIELSEALSTINKENPSDAEAKVARRNRLDLVSNRTSSDKIKKELKSGLLIEEELIDNLYGVVKNTSQLIEAEYEKIEKFAENREKERKEALKSERLELLTPYTDNADKFDLANMEEQTFNELFSGIKMQKEAKEAADKKVQEEKEEKERIEKLRSQRSIEIQPYAQFFENAESVSLGEISQDEYNKLYIDLQEKKKDYDVMIENQRLQNEKLKEEAAIKESRTTELMPYATHIRDINTLLVLDEEEYQLQFADIRKSFQHDIDQKAAAEEKLLAEKSKRTESAHNFLLKNGFIHTSGGVTSKEFKYFISINRYSSFENDEQLETFKNQILINNDRDKKAKDQEAENAKLAKELQEKKDKEAKDAADKVAAEKAKLKAEKDLLKAGDKVRIINWIDKIILPEIDTKGMTEESVFKVKDIIDKVDKMKSWAKSEAEKI
jgi:hypothetical protein